MFRGRRRGATVALGLVLLFVAAGGVGALIAAHTRSSSQPSAGNTNSDVTGAPPAGSELAIASAHPNLVVQSTPNIDPDGAIGTNRGAWHSLGFQRPFGNDVESALIKQDPGGLSLAIKALEYSYEHQLADGSFQVVQVAGAPYQLNTDPIVGTIFFYGDLGHALELLQDSTWYQTSADTASVRARVEALRPKIALGMQWLSAPSQLPTVENTGRKDTNRATFGAEAFLLTGEWLNDSADTSIGAGLLHQAEGNLQPDGTILEKGGFDSGYQSVSLDNLLRMSMHLGGGLAFLKPPLWTMISKGVAREEQAIQPTGQVSHANNTRTYCGGETFRGKPKQGGGNDVVRVLVYYASLTGNPALITTAQRIVTFYATNTHSLCAPPT